MQRVEVRHLLSNRNYHKVRTLTREICGVDRIVTGIDITISRLGIARAIRATSAVHVGIGRQEPTKLEKILLLEQDDLSFRVTFILPDTGLRNMGRFASIFRQHAFQFFTRFN